MDPKMMCDYEGLIKSKEINIISADKFDNIEEDDPKLNCLLDSNCTALTQNKEDSASSYWSQIIAAISATTFYILTGLPMGFSAILLPQLKMPDSDLKATTEECSWIASMMTLMFAFSAVGVGYIADSFGRLTTLRMGVVPYVVGWACMALATNVPVMLLGRALTGLAKAMHGFPALDYTTEVVLKDVRGTISCAAMAFPGVGLVAVYIMGKYLHWRTVAWLTLSLSIAPLVLITVFATESPLWLISKDRVKEAEKSLSFLLRAKPSKVQKELQSMMRNEKRKQTDYKTASFCRLFNYFTKQKGYKPLIIISLLFILQQCSGTHVIIFYAVALFQAVGTTIDPHMCTVAVGCIKVVFGLFTAYLMRHFGRRPLLIGSGTGMAVSIFFAGYFTREISEGKVDPNAVPAVCLLLYTTFAILGMMTIPWTLASEFFPLEVRGRAHGLVLCLAHLFITTILKIYPFLPVLLGGMYHLLWLFAGMSFASVVFVFVFIPETNNKTIDEIQEYFHNSNVYILRKKSVLIKKDSRLV